MIWLRESTRSFHGGRDLAHRKGEGAPSCKAVQVEDKDETVASAEQPLTRPVNSLAMFPNLPFLNGEEIHLK